MTIPSHCGSATSDSPRILPRTIVYREIGETKISWLKSCSRSASSEIRPCAVDCQIVIPRTPVKTKCSRFTPARSPNPVCRLVPRIPMKMTGNANSAIMRCRSRMSLVKSRCAMTRIAEASLIACTHDLEIGILEARRVRPHDAERGLDRAEDRVDGVSVQLDLERRTAIRHVAESRTIRRVDEDVVLDEVALYLGGRAERNDATFVDDANAIGVLGLLEV